MVKDQKSRSPGTKNALCIHNTPVVWTEWNAVVTDNLAQAAGATIPSLQRGVFAWMCALGLAGYRWALPCIYRLPVLCCYFLTIVWSKEISETTRPIFTKFSGLADMWL